jgi:heterodisulfide reductase subunit A-like polyferredoxin
MEKHPQLGPNETIIDGIFLAGAVQQPMHVYEALVHASAAAMKSLSFIHKKRKLTKNVKLVESG